MPSSSSVIAKPWLFSPVFLARRSKSISSRFDKPLSSESSGSTTTTDTQEDDLLDGLWYINIHTNDVPGGEIRAQVDAAIVPEPSVYATLIGAFALGLVAFRRRRRTGGENSAVALQAELKGEAEIATRHRIARAVGVSGIEEVFHVEGKPSLVLA